MRLIRQKCFAGDSAFYTQCPDGAGTMSDNVTTKNGKILSDWRESQPAFRYLNGRFEDHELDGKEFKDKPVIKKVKRGGKSVYRIGAHFNYDPKKYGPVGPGNRTSFIIGASDKEKVSDVYRDFLKHIKALDDYGYTTDKESIEEVKKSLKKEIRHQAKKAKMKKIGTTAAITAGVAGAAYGGKKLYDHYKKNKT